MINRTQLMLTTLCTCLCTLSAADNTRIPDITHGLDAVRLAAQQQADTQIDFFKQGITATEQEIIDTEKALASNNEAYMNRQQTFDETIARLTEEFNVDVTPKREEEVRLKRALTELRKKLTQQQQEKALFEKQAAHMIAGFVVVDGPEKKNGPRRQARQASINGAPETEPKQYRKGEFVPSELWALVPEALKPYFGTEENE